MTLKAHSKFKSKKEKIEFKHDAHTHTKSEKCIRSKKNSNMYVSGAYHVPGNVRAFKMHGLLSFSSTT